MHKKNYPTSVRNNSKFHYRNMTNASFINLFCEVDLNINFRECIFHHLVKRNHLEVMA